MQIDHNPNERRPPRWFWWSIFAVIGVLWIGLFIKGGIEWSQIMLGIGTGGILAGWAMEMTGGVTPSSWRRKPPTRNR